MLGIVTQKYHNLQIESLKKEFDEKLSDVTLSLSKSEGVRSFNMAKMDRLTADWLSFVRDFNYDLKVGGSRLIARARELYQNDPYAKKLVTEKRKGIVGPKGFVLRNNAGEFGIQNGGYKFIKDKLANGIINEQWWQYSKNKYITLEGDESLRAHCGSLLSAVMIDGEVFIKKLSGPKFNPFGFTTQTIPAERCAWTLNHDYNGNHIIMGIEVDNEWRKVAYWFRKGNPKQFVDYGDSWSNNYERIEADKIIHLYVKELPHQLRGVTLFAPVGIRLRMLYQFEESSLMRANVSARVPGMISKQPNVMGANSIPGMQVQQKDDSGDWIMQLANGEFLKVKDGYQVTNLESSYPHQLQGDFQKHMLRSISAGGDIGFSTMSNNYEAVTWHSGKLEKQRESDAYLKSQKFIFQNYLNHIYGDRLGWLEMAALAGKFILPSGKTLPVLDKLEKFNQPLFYGRSWEYTNPKEEREANIMAVQSFQKTFEQVLGEQGIDLEEHLDNIAAERQMFKDKGLDEFYTLFMTKYPTTPIGASEDDAEDKDKDKDESTVGDKDKNKKENMEKISSMLQRLYLPVNSQQPLLTADEARMIVNVLGAGLEGTAHDPKPIVNQNNNSGEEDNKNNNTASGGNGNGKAHAINVHS